jgi:hypothetical protein
MLFYRAALPLSSRTLTFVARIIRRYRISIGSCRRKLKDGLAGLADHSHRPHFQPRQIHADVEAVISQLRGAHPRWGPRRLQFELGKAGVSPVPSRSTVYRVLVRHGLVAARKRKLEFLNHAGPFATIEEAPGRSRCVAGGIQSPPPAPVPGHGLPS